MAKDPVCGKEVDPELWKTGAVQRYLHEGNYYFFCGLECRVAFVGNPASYLGSAEKA